MQFIKILSTVLAVGMFCAVSAQNVTLTTQAEVDAFNKGITTIEGDLTIGFIYGKSSSTINNLGALSNVSAIRGDLHIFYNGTLADLDGLSKLKTIGGKLSIYRNPSLENLRGLSNLRTIGGDCSISGNDGLRDLAGLSKLATIGARLMIDNNDNLSNLDGLSGLTTVKSHLLIDRSYALESISGLSNLTYVGKSLVITKNDKLRNLDGLSKLTVVEKDLEIKWNKALENIDGLSNITSIGVFLVIDGNPQITNIDALSKVTSMQYLMVMRNDNLTNINGLSKVGSVAKALSIKGNPKLSDCCGVKALLSKIRTLPEGMEISNNATGCDNSTAIRSSPCGKKTTISPVRGSSTKTYKIGDEHPSGGIVFEVTNGGRNGLVAAPRNSPTPTKGWDAAKQYCASQGKGWRMPSKEEMRTMVTNLAQNGDLTSRYFWTSTEHGDSEAYIVLRQNGVLNWPSPKSGEKNYVRPIRSF